MSTLPSSFFYKAHRESARRAALIRRDSLIRRQVEAVVSPNPSVSPALLEELSLIGRLLALRRAGLIEEPIYATEGRYRIGTRRVSLEAIRAIVERLEEKTA